MRKLAEAGGLMSVDDDIDAIAREALEEARRMDEALRYRSNPGPIVAPEKTAIASRGLSDNYPGSRRSP